jgi:hypothetical protein
LNAECVPGVVHKWTFLTPDVLGCYASLAGTHGAYRFIFW